MTKLERQLKLPSVIAISISTMLGSGIFVLPGLAAAHTGPSIWLAYLAAGVCVIPATLSKAELGTAMPTAGGTYVYLDRTFGPLVGTVAGIGLWLSLLLKSSFALVGFTAYLVVLVDVEPRITALIAVVAIVALNIRGVLRVSQVQIVVVLLALGGAAVLFGAGLFAYDPSRLEPMFRGGAGGFLTAVTVVFVSYAGVTKVAAIAEEIRNPERNLPRGMLLSLGIAMVVYGAVTFVLVTALPLELIENDVHPIYTLAAFLGGEALGIVIAVLGVLTMTSMANAGLLAASRFPFAMSRDALLPARLSSLHRRYLTPTTSILCSGAAMAVAIVSFDVERIAKLASAFMIMLFIAANVAVVVLRETGVKWYRPAYRSPMYPAIQVFGVLTGFGLLAVMGLLAVAAGVAIVLPGAAAYAFYGRRRTERRGVVGIRGRRTELLRHSTQMGAASGAEAPEAESGSDAAVVVALFGGERSPELLVELGAALADGGGRVSIAMVNEVPEQTSLDAGRDDVAIASCRRRVLAVGETHRVPLGFNAYMSRDILETVSELTNRAQCQWLVMGWSGRSRYSFTFRNPLGWLKDHLACNLATFHDAGVRYIRRILVYVEPGPHDALIARTADHLASVHGADLTFVRFVPAHADLAQRQAVADYLDQIRELCQAPTEVVLAHGRDEASAIGLTSAAYDLMVTAEPPRGGFLSSLRGAGRDRLTEAAACSVLRLQTPRGHTHVAMERVDTGSHSVAPKIAALLREDCCLAMLPPLRKDALFAELARSFATAVPSVSADEIVAALEERERTQNTAVGHGVALPHATLAALDRTYLGIFTTDGPIDYAAPDDEGVDIFFATIGPPGERQKHLWLLASIARLTLQSDLLTRLRAATDRAGIIAAVERAAHGLGL